ncbi:hypothetical protein SKA58_06140 [Sphingomonas sp. SKA58]|nr:hypothetical protein SKA58_06140 [Sphingomonas sp. SKA58]
MIFTSSDPIRSFSRYYRYPVHPAACARPLVAQRGSCIASIAVRAVSP